jgi:hypothetical protein
MEDNMLISTYIVKTTLWRKAHADSALSVL